jgi:hypothetical protein
VRASANPPWLALTVVGGILLIGFTLGGIWLNTNARPATPAGSGAPPPALATQAVQAPVGSDGVQTLDVVVNGDTMSYRPRVIRVKQGVPVRFNLSTEGRDPGCGRLVTFKGLGIRGIATPGQVTPLEFTPGQAGTFEINCGMNMMQPGTLIVTQ